MLCTHIHLHWWQLLRSYGQKTNTRALGQCVFRHSSSSGNSDGCSSVIKMCRVSTLLLRRSFRRNGRRRCRPSMRCRAQSSSWQACASTQTSSRAARCPTRSAWQWCHLTRCDTQLCVECGSCVGSSWFWGSSLAVVSSDQVRDAAVCKSVRFVSAAPGVDPLAWRWCFESSSKPNSWQLCGGWLGSVSSSTAWDM